VYSQLLLLNPVMVRFTYTPLLSVLSVLTPILPSTSVVNTLVRMASIHPQA